MDVLIDLYANVFTDPEIAKNLRKKRTKVTCVLKNVLGVNFPEGVLENVRAPVELFSLIIDETTDVSTLKPCAIAIIYFDEGKIKTRFFDMVEIRLVQSYYMLVRKKPSQTK